MKKIESFVKEIDLKKKHVEILELKNILAEMRAQ